LCGISEFSTQNAEIPHTFVSINVFFKLSNTPCDRFQAQGMCCSNTNFLRMYSFLTIGDKNWSCGFLNFGLKLAWQPLDMVNQNWFSIHIRTQLFHSTSRFYCIYSGANFQQNPCLDHGPLFFQTSMSIASWILKSIRQNIY
jgi:hypothetical protein